MDTCAACNVNFQEHVSRGENVCSKCNKVSKVSLIVFSYLVQSAIKNTAPVLQSIKMREHDRQQPRAIRREVSISNWRA